VNVEPLRTEASAVRRSSWSREATSIGRAIVSMSMSAQIVRVWKASGTAEGVDRYCREHFSKKVLPQLR
jgi:hypothetical protein